MHYPNEHLGHFHHAAVNEPTTINVTVPQCMFKIVQEYIENRYDLELEDTEHDEIGRDFPVTTLSFDTRANEWDMQHDLVAIKKWPVHIEVRNSSDESAFMYTKLHEGVIVYNTFTERDDCIAARTVLNLLESADIEELARMCHETVERTQHWAFTEAEVMYANQIAMRELVKP